MTETPTETGAGRATPGSLLRWHNNPRSSLDYVMALHCTAAANGCRIKIRYVPDRLVLDAASFANYLAAMPPTPDAAPETLALALLDEINNEIVPRWVQISLSIERAGVPAETVILTDRQPNWENPEILNTLPPL